MPADSVVIHEVTDVYYLINSVLPEGVYAEPEVARVFKREVGDALTPEFLEGMILKLVTEWAKEGEAEITVNDADKERLEALLFSHLKEDLKGSVSLRVSSTVSKGFRIELKGENVYYDFTDDTIADALKAFINPSLQAILDRDDG